MKTIELEITNNHNHSQCIQIFDVFNPLPDFVDIKHDDYKVICNYINHTPCAARVIKTSNNRQVYFYEHDGYSYLPMEPQLNKHSQPRKRIYYKINEGCDDEFETWRYEVEWNPDKWNLADTHEHFLMSNKTSIHLHLNAGQTFKISVRMAATKAVFDKNKIDNFLKQQNE